MSWAYPELKNNLYLKWYERFMKIGAKFLAMMIKNEQIENDAKVLARKSLIPKSRKELHDKKPWSSSISL